MLLRIAASVVGPATHAILALEPVDEPGATQDFGVEAFGRKEQDAEVGGLWRGEILVPNVFGARAHARFHRGGAIASLRPISRGLRVLVNIAVSVNDRKESLPNRFCDLSLVRGTRRPLQLQFEVGSSSTSSTTVAHGTTTATGVVRRVIVPSPSCPSRLLPQQYAMVVRPHV